MYDCLVRSITFVATISTLSMAFHNFDELLFHSRNREYGAYDLRNRYARNIMIGLGVAVLFISIVAAAIYLEVALRRRVVLPYQTFVVDLSQIPSIYDEANKPASRRRSADEQETFTVPIVTKDIIQTPPTKFDNEKSKNENDTSKTSINGSLNGSSDGYGDGYGDVLFVAQEMPEFIGGQNALYAFLRKNTIYPDSLRRKNINGTVLVQFVVTQNGDIRDVEVINNVHPYLKNEALRVVRKMPAWKPGHQGGNAVNVYFRLPFVFK
jgi:periplasmic protein TonB